MNFTKSLVILLLCAALPALAATNHSVSYKQKIAKLNVTQDGNSGGQIESFYDSSTNLIEELKYDSSRNMLEKTEYAYDKDNNRISSVYYNCFGWLCSKAEYSYDGKGNVLVESQYINGTLLDQEKNPTIKAPSKISTNVTLNNRVAHSYDRTGNRIKSIRFDCNEDVCYIDEFSYTNNDKLLVQSRSLGKKILNRSKFKYDTNGFKIEEISYTSNDIKFQKIRFVNDKNGKAVRQMTYSADDSLWETRTFAYDENKNIISMKAFDANGQKTGSIEKIYNQNNLCVEMDEYNGIGKPIRKQQWEYDINKNMIHDVVYLFKDKEQILYQDIEYTYIY